MKNQSLSRKSDSLWFGYFEFFIQLLDENYLDNMIVCQFDKIQRVRNKWRFYLKDGIMHLNGKDYVFQKATGEGEW